MTPKTTYQKGLYAEALAAILLRIKGFKVMQQRYKTAYGEIDLIATKGQLVIFVEVKNRRDEARALEAIHVKSQKRIIHAAQYFLSEYPQFVDYDMRFDVIVFTGRGLPVHHENMWQA